MGRTNTEDARQLVSALDRYRRAIEITAHAAAAGIDIVGGSGAATAVTTASFKIWKKAERPVTAPAPIKSISEERERLEKRLKSLDSAVVVLIDELDRVEDDDVRAVAQLVKAVGDIRGISYLVAYDPKRVAEALGRGTGEDRVSSGNLYIEKIIQHPIPMRPIFSDDVERLLEATLAAHQVDPPPGESDDDQAIIERLKQSVKTPREIKRLIGSFSIIEAAVRGEVNSAHILAYCWILTKAPELRDRIAADLDKYVDDPSGDEIYRRAGKPKEEIASDALLGPEAGPFEPLLKRMFPRFGEEPKDLDGTRLSRRRNLVRVLYLGNPPGMVPRQIIEDVWDLPGTDVEDALKEMGDAGTLAEFLDRLDDLLPKLPPSGDKTFWPALSRTFERPTDWIHGPEPERSLSDDASLSLFQLGIRDGGNVSRVKATVQRLIDSGDLLIAPWMLRRHMFQHGLVEGQRARNGDTIYDADETRDLLKREVPRYREALLNGTLLRRIPDVEALFVLKNGGFWDTELTSSLSEQLTTPDAICTFAALFTPPGHIVERKTIEEMTDIDQLTMLASDLPQPPDPWLAASLKRFKLTLAGKDPTFAREDLD